VLKELRSDMVHMLLGNIKIMLLQRRAYHIIVFAEGYVNDFSYTEAAAAAAWSLT
jgi:hypothetical protein